MRNAMTKASATWLAPKSTAKSWSRSSPRMRDRKVPAETSPAARANPRLPVPREEAADSGGSLEELGSSLDVGWGSDVSQVRAALPQTFLNLRLSPMRMLSEPTGVIRADVERLLAAAGDPANVGLCCINMDYGTPDENVRAVIEMV